MWEKMASVFWDSGMLERRDVEGVFYIRKKEGKWGGKEGGRTEEEDKKVAIPLEVSWEIHHPEHSLL